MASLKGKIALISGASAGIGAATAVHFAGLGCNLSLIGRNSENLDKVIVQCIEAGAKCDVLKIVADVTKDEDLERIITTTINHFQHLDILVNSAGIILSGTVESTDINSYDAVMNVNVRSIFQLSQLAIPHLKKSKGNIVNLSSVAGTRAFPGVAAYCISKAAVDQLTRCAALELASDGVRVNAVNPGVIITDIHKKSGMSDADYAKFLHHCKDTHALGRPGTVDEVAQSISFLANDASSSFITGVTLLVDGGRGVMCPR